MRKKVADVGDVPIDFRVRQFSTNEAAAISGVPHKAIRNYERVQEFHVGHRTFTGRPVFNVADMITLRVMYYLNVRFGMTAAQVARVAEYAGEMAMLMPRETRTGKLAKGPIGDTILVAFDEETGELVCTTASIDHPGHYLPPPHDAGKASPLRAPHLTIPVDAIRRDVVERLCALTEKNGADEEE